MQIVWVVVVVAWLLLFPEHKLIMSLVMVCSLALITLISSKLLSHYEKTGRAVRIRYPRTVFVKGLPLGMVSTRLAVLLIVATMLGLGLAPISIDEAKPGIIACVLSLFALAFLDFFLEARAIKTGQANEVTLPDEK